MSSLIENQSKIQALEAEIVELKAEMVVFKAEMTRRLAGLEAERRLYLEQQTSAGRNINVHGYLFQLFPSIFNLFPFHFI
jgi:hypothetical protein